ncbi:hypothetical protein U8326_11620 [Tsuneonella sp. CC-YZS046]|uniref:hypothetical protein n=1 Tax=Tsuneonella sp. CC-YZS046 TaxID=3042152 RepID=UPI002D7A1CC8|nr:hypothetical protein [Tsuneonella sp. CC-YZS046]WRO65697.1 hypothetical protein U8326_11620 [Tsuneonella sp. CC-YZS046]
MRIAHEPGGPPASTGRNLPHGSPAGMEPAPLPFAALMAAYSANPGNPAEHETAALAATIIPGTIIPNAVAAPAPAQPEIAAIWPAIGEGAHPFCASALLVSTAFPPQTAGAGAEPRMVQPAAGSTPGLTLPQSDPAMTLAAPFEASRSASLGSSAPALPQGSHLPGPALLPRGASPAAMTSTAAASAPPRPGLSAQTQPDSRPAGERSSSVRSRSALADPSRPAATATALAQFVPLEGGLRLVLRLPRLPDDMRAELEARLHQLLAAFGHSRHELLIRQSGRG